MAKKPNIPTLSSESTATVETIAASLATPSELTPDLAAELAPREPTIEPAPEPLGPIVGQRYRNLVQVRLNVEAMPFGEIPTAITRPAARQWHVQLNASTSEDNQRYKRIVARLREHYLRSDARLLDGRPAGGSDAATIKRLLEEIDAQLPSDPT